MQCAVVVCCSVVHHNSHSKNLFRMPKRTSVNIRLKTLLDRSLLLWYSWLALAAQQRCNLRSSINCGKIQGGVSVLHARFSFVRYRLIWQACPHRCVLLHAYCKVPVAYNRRADLHLHTHQQQNTQKRDTKTQTQRSHKRKL